MKTIAFSAGDVIFREGEFQLRMYDVLSGSIGIYLDYDSEQKKQLTVLRANQLLGEMGLIESCPRSATAVALEDGTTLREIDEAEFLEFFRNEPERLLQILRQLSARIRENTEQYHEVCRALSAKLEAERAGKEKSEALEQQLTEISKAAAKKRPRPGLRSSFYTYVQEDLDAYEGKRDVVRVSLLERLVVRSIPPQEMHVNPDDEFADPDIGPSERIINEYAHEIPRFVQDMIPVFPEPIMVYKIKPEGYLILNGHHRWAAAVKTGLGKVRVAILNPPK